MRAIEKGGFSPGMRPSSPSKHPRLQQGAIRYLGEGNHQDGTTAFSQAVVVGDGAGHPSSDDGDELKDGELDAGLFSPLFSPRPGSRLWRWFFQRSHPPDSE